MSGRWRMPAAAVASLAALLAVALVAGAKAGDRSGRTVVLTIRHSRFSPAVIDVTAGEPLRVVLRNTDPIDHELIVGPDHVQQAHELGTEAWHPPRPGEVSVAAESTAETTYVVPMGLAEVPFACHLPGHLAHGMAGVLRVRAGP